MRLWRGYVPYSSLPGYINWSLHAVPFFYRAKWFHKVVWSYISKGLFCIGSYWNNLSYNSHKKWTYVIAKYAGHVRRLLLMSGRELRPCRRFCPEEFNVHRMPDKENNNDHCYLSLINWENSLTFAQNVPQSTEGVWHARHNFRDHWTYKSTCSKITLSCWNRFHTCINDST